METKKYSELSESSKLNADWEVNQRNKVSEYCNSTTELLTNSNCLFYTNGVYSGKALVSEAMEQESTLS